MAEPSTRPQGGRATRARPAAGPAGRPSGPQGEKGADGKTGRGPQVLGARVLPLHLEHGLLRRLLGQGASKYVSGCYYRTRAAQTWENPSTPYTTPVYDPSLTEALSASAT